jgi:hypothetical protein
MTNKMRIALAAALIAAVTAPAVAQAKDHTRHTGLREGRNSAVMAAAGTHEYYNRNSPWQSSDWQRNPVWCSYHAYDCGAW